MTPSLLLIILSAAFLHALWNAIVKGAPDRTLVLGFIALGHVVPALFVLPFTGLPAPASYPFIIGSTVVHWGYYWFLHIAYRTGDLSVVYPISRGITPVLVTTGAVVFAGEYLPFEAWMGILLISAGIAYLSLGGAGQGKNLSAIAAALATGAMIASYSLIDGFGIRLSQNNLGYIAVLFVAEIFVAVFVLTTRWERVHRLAPRHVLTGLAGGVISGLAYALVLYAKTLAPLGIVSALRESSVIFAALIGVMWFGEGPKSNRLLAASIVAVGIVVLAFYK
ncbi:hypothetical protein J7382_09985 [Shimia sp. R11_0]|uniref:Phosphonate utilization associated putative membrane protein n=1 Tax=Shimia marina TaxID=321267 RepID=A0A0P1EKI8_9RHOB|nr:MULTISPECIES: DMT family transporter [Shimia]MBO9477863.1 hypothetical protein [Shimia sp. R11_0]CUH50701.1 phosphonate utilization associated putative membrane protein [Shimia marina]SFE36430.1 Uncharacterized membrane protein [Shimia marina]